LRGEQLALTATLIVTVLLQARLARYRLLLVAGGAGTSCLISSLSGGATTARLLAGVPWDVIVILIGLGLLSELLAASQVFGLLAVRVARISGAQPLRVLVLFAVGMYAVSGLVNNLTALMLVLPVVLSLLVLMGSEARYLRWTLSTLLIACNLGGAATPIGDFPAILLLGRGAMGFSEYLREAAPATLVALVLVLLGVLAMKPASGLETSRLGQRLTLATLGALYRNVRIDRRVFWPGALALGAMVIAWLAVPSSWGVGPELICWLGAGLALVSSPRLAERLLRTRVDLEAALFLLFLFVMVGAVHASGVFGDAARGLISLPLPDWAQLVVFLTGAAVLTGLFSAGPSMAALLEVAEVLAARFPPHAVYVGLALSVCAGSSLFLTAATSGPLTQALVERTRVRDAEGRPLHFDFAAHVPAGLLGFAVTLAVGLGYALLGM
jgi:Na+/H+ antiporter NhaD/arsenite permease-like protein